MFVCYLSSLEMNVRQGNLFAVFGGKECETGKPICCVLWKET